MRLCPPPLFHPLPEWAGEYFRQIWTFLAVCDIIFLCPGIFFRFSPMDFPFSFVSVMTVPGRGEVDVNVTNDRFNELMDKVRNRDVDALKEIYSEYAGYVYHIAFSMLNHREDAEDVASDVFVKLWDRADQVQKRGSHKGYLATVTRNLALDLLRKTSRREAYDEHAIGNMASNEDLEERVTDSVLVEQLLGTLNEDCRLILHLKYYGGLTLDEIASSMGLPVGTVNWKYAQARSVLRRCGYEA